MNAVQAVEAVDEAVAEAMEEAVDEARTRHSSDAALDAGGFEERSAVQIRS